MLLPNESVKVKVTSTKNSETSKFWLALVWSAWDSGLSIVSFPDPTTHARKGSGDTDADSWLCKLVSVRDQERRLQDQSRIEQLKRKKD